jgi:hypothetical protein
MPVYVCVCFDVCAAAPFDARRLLCQAMRYDVCSFSCQRIKESSKWGSGFLIPVYTQQSTTKMSPISTPSLLRRRTRLAGAASPTARHRIPWLTSYQVCRSCLLMPVYVCVCFDVCAAAPFDARRLLCQAMPSDVCSYLVLVPKDQRKFKVGYTQQSTTQMSCNLNPIFNTYSRSPRCFYPQ